MTKVKLTDGTIISASDVEQVGDLLKITTSELTVEELAGLFSNKENTTTITLMTESEIESGSLEHYTGFSGITYDSEGTKVVTLVYETKSTPNVEIGDLTKKVSNLEATINALLGTEV